MSYMGRKETKKREKLEKCKSDCTHVAGAGEQRRHLAQVVKV